MVCKTFTLPSGLQDSGDAGDSSRVKGGFAQGSADTLARAAVAETLPGFKEASKVAPNLLTSELEHGLGSERRAGALGRWRPRRWRGLRCREQTASEKAGKVT